MAGPQAWVSVTQGGRVECSRVDEIDASVLILDQHLAVGGLGRGEVGLIDKVLWGTVFTNDHGLGYTTATRQRERRPVSGI